GGKAASLAVAARAGLPVPVGVALPFGFVDAIAAGDAEARQQLAAIFRTLGAPLVARSSAVGEDSEQATFAGQYLTRLNLRSEPAPGGAPRRRCAWSRPTATDAYPP